MSRVGEYVDRIFLTALGSPKVQRVEKVRQVEDATGHSGFIRYRLTLINDDLLELTEYIEIQAGEILVTKYRHHWQNKQVNLSSAGTMPLIIDKSQVFRIIFIMMWKKMLWSIHR